MRGKASPRSTRPARSNANTLRKVQVFEWAIDRIGAQLKSAGDEETAASERERTRAAPEYTVEQLERRPRRRCLIGTLRYADGLEVASGTSSACCSYLAPTAVASYFAPHDPPDQRR
jgi:hypothetical protein